MTSRIFCHHCQLPMPVLANQQFGWMLLLCQHSARVSNTGVISLNKLSEMNKPFATGSSMPGHPVRSFMSNESQPTTKKSSDLRMTLATSPSVADLGKDLHLRITAHLAHGKFYAVFDGDTKLTGDLSLREAGERLVQEKEKRRAAATGAATFPRLEELRIEECEYQLEESGPWLPGVVINEGDGYIISLSGQRVRPPVWDWRTIGGNVMIIRKQVQP